MQADPHLARAKDYVARAQAANRHVYSVFFIEGSDLIVYEVGWRYDANEKATPTLFGKRVRPVPGGAQATPGTPAG